MLTSPLSRSLLLCTSLLLGLAVTGCETGCLRGEPGCRLPSPCGGVAFTCADGSLELRQLDEAGARASRSGQNALAARGDILLGNSQIVAVVAGLGNQNFLDAGGGSLLDLRRRGGPDRLNQTLQVVGILPRDAPVYTEVLLIDERPARVAVQLRGTLDGQPDMHVYTLYEVRPCDLGVRVRTEVLNGAADTQLWALMDGYYWSGRELMPFTPGGGYTHPSFDLLTINDAFREAPFLAASSHSPGGAAYAAVSCDALEMAGFHSGQVSAMGLRRTVVPPRDHQIFERFFTVGEGGDVAAAADLARRLRGQLFGEELTRLSGRVRGGLPGTEAGASVQILDRGGEAPAPVSVVVPAADGSFSALVPRGRSYAVEVHAFGRKVGAASAQASGAELDLGEIGIAAPARLVVTVSADGAMQPLEAEVFLVPADEATRSGSLGSLFGVSDQCAPWLGPGFGASPACNRLLVPRDRPAEAAIPPGRYYAYAYHGPFFTIARKPVEVTGGERVNLDFALRALPLTPRGAVSADLHVHGAASFDSSIPDEDRVLSFAAADVGVIVATDHDVVHDYGEAVRALGLGARISTVAGVETTGHIPYLQVPGDPFPHVIGHYNFWPLVYQPGLPRNGGPFDERVEPGELFDRVEALYQPGRTSLIQLNHPYADPEFGRDLGFPRAVGLNLLADLPASDDGTGAGMYVRAPRGGHRNDDHHAQEVMNGTQNDLLLPYRAFWFYMLNQGRLRTGTANSDSHGLTDNTVGAPRNLVFADTQPGPLFDVDRFNQAIRDGAVLGTNGPVILATMDTAMGEVSYGLGLQRPLAGGRLKLEVSAAPWVPVEEVRIIVNGRVVRTIDGAALHRPADPFGAMGLQRYRGELLLDELLPAAGDCWLVVEAGAKLPLSGDLGGGADGGPDGVPDTTDNNGDGVVDQRDIDPGRRTGPLKNPAMPTDESDPRFHFAQVVTGGYPMAFTNPFVLDRDGNGRFDAPGVRGGR